MLLRLIAGTDAPDARRHPHRRPLGARPAGRRSATSAWRSRTSPSTRTSPRSRTSRARSQARGLGRGRDQGSRSRRSQPSCASATCSATARASCPTARSSAPRWRRALVRGPGVLLLDDPLRNVDAKLRYEMRLELPRLLAELRLGRDLRHPGLSRGHGAGPAHRRPAPAAASSRWAPPASIYAEPANVEIARLFGDPTINLFPLPRRRRCGVELFGERRAAGRRHG